MNRRASFNSIPFHSIPVVPRIHSTTFWFTFDSPCFNGFDQLDGVAVGLCVYLGVHACIPCSDSAPDSLESNGIKYSSVAMADALDRHGPSLQRLLLK